MKYDLADGAITCTEAGRAKPESVYWIRDDRAPGCGAYWAIDYRRADGGVGTVRTFLSRDLAGAHLAQILARLKTYEES